MERHVKERLIGAALLVAAAVILIPEMLAGSGRDGARETPPAAGNAPLKTYTIDLNRSPAAPLPAGEQVSEQAPPPELSEPGQAMAMSAPAADSSASADQSRTPDPVPAASTDARPPEPRVSDTPPPTATPRSTPAAAAPRPVTAPARTSTPPATQQASPAASSGWVVQLGSFSSQSTAARLASQYKADGYDAFVMPVKSGANTLYRVRLGPPVADRDAATRVLSKVKGKVPGAAVVHHP